MLFSNPAFLPLGRRFHRWAGNTFTVLCNKESLSTAQTMAKNAKSGKGASTGQSSQELVDQVFTNPLRVGWGDAFSWLTNNFGVAAFSRFEPDIEAHKFGSAGLPEIELTAESYNGAIMAGAWRTGVRWLTLSLAAKYLLASESDLHAALTDRDKITQFTKPQSLQSRKELNRGAGADVGSLMFFQGNSVDFLIAAKVDDVGGTKMSGTVDAPVIFKQVVSGGLGLTFHTGADAIHFAADYRDALGAYGEPLFKRIHAGTKLMLRTYIGVAAGYYDGYPSAGAEIDLLLVRLGVTAFTRELGEHPGVDPRHIYMVSASLGF